MTTFSELTKSQQKSTRTAILRLLKKYPTNGLTSSYISDQLQLSPRTTVNILRFLRDSGSVDYSTGGTKQHDAGIWHILPGGGDIDEELVETLANQEKQNQSIPEQPAVGYTTPTPDMLDELLLKGDVKLIVQILRETCTEPIDPQDVYLITRLLTNVVGYSRVMLDTINASLAVLLQHCTFHGFAETGGRDFTNIKSHYNHDQDGL